jgi:hypothetical protein
MVGGVSRNCRCASIAHGLSPMLAPAGRYSDRARVPPFAGNRASTPQYRSDPPAPPRTRRHRRRASGRCCKRSAQSVSGLSGRTRLEIPSSNDCMILQYPGRHGIWTAGNPLEAEYKARGMSPPYVCHASAVSESACSTAGAPLECHQLAGGAQWQGIPTDCKCYFLSRSACTSSRY